MCGICGVLSLAASEPAERDAVLNMAALLAHRGPDDDGIYADGPIALAVRRLSIIDVAGGAQPIANEDHTIHVVQNGEIYNYKELRRELQARGHCFRTQSDTEVIVHLYEQDGPSFAARLRGMFAIALWDAARRRLVLARDRFGIKPLLYTRSAKRLAFSSELKSLRLSPEFQGRVSLQALRAYLTFNWVPGTDTIFENVHRLAPGHVLVAEDGRQETFRYGGPLANGGDRSIAGEPHALAEELLSRLRDSVRAHLVADVPVGVLLSGGIDSSLVTALAAESTTRLKTFSIGFADPRFNELGKARLVASRFGTDHHELLVRPDVAALLPTLAATYDEPLGDSSALPTYLVSELAARDVKVVLAGDGGDELFGGYFTYVANWLAQFTWPLARAVRPLIDRLPDTRSRVADRAKRFAAAGHAGPVERHCGWSEVFSPAAVDAILEPGWRAESDPLVAHRIRYAQTADLASFTRLQDLDVAFYLHNDLLMKVDLAGMAHSLEIRVPMLDVSVSDFAYRLPARFKVRGFQKKRLLRAAARELLPPDILDAPKQGFSIPAAAWLRAELRPLMEESLAPPALGRQGFFRPAAVERLIREHVERRADHSRRLWGILMFTLWYDTYGRLE